MAHYFVQPVKDREGRVNAWEVAKKHGQGTTRISDHRKKRPAIKNARRVASMGDKIGIKNRKGSYSRWITSNGRGGR
jgi:hypothetical protein